ncbi:MAG: hypothetical protein KDA60_09220 [Planctomycetales bacterium]|nr:hypothetical protein [Planctomycetales bacterium]
MHDLTRRKFLSASAAAVAGTLDSWGPGSSPHFGPSRVFASADEVGLELLNPRARVPLSFVIDDSTCLVNMGHFCMPQFAQAWPDRDIYHKPWKTWPREIPDSFVREFGTWCALHGVKGKYSIVPYPACVGWLDRGLPGWSAQELEASLRLVRELMVPHWDIHPEMITHTRAIDLKTRRPYAEATSATMENSFPQDDRSVDELAEYLALALNILKNCGLPAEGITTPGGFGNRVKDKLPQAVYEAVTDVYGTELPHFFKYVREGEESTAPELENVGTPANPRVVMNVLAGTGDWFGGWDGDRSPEPDRYATADGTAGRMVELIKRGQPAIMLCHWPGMYSQGSWQGYYAFQRVVESLEQHYARETIWMKMSEIGRYWAARQMTRIARVDAQTLTLDAPWECRWFTFRLATAGPQPATYSVNGEPLVLREVRDVNALESNTFHATDAGTTYCVDLARGVSQLRLG